MILKTFFAWLFGIAEKPVDEIVKEFDVVRTKLLSAVNYHRTQQGVAQAQANEALIDVQMHASEANRAAAIASNIAALISPPAKTPLPATAKAA